MIQGAGSHPQMRTRFPRNVMVVVPFHVYMPKGQS
jgi:hypothetical protein